MSGYVPPPPYPVGTIREAPVHLVRAGTGKVIPFGRNAADVAAVGAALLAAQSEASANDLIEVFADADIDSPLGKHLVRWRFGPVVVTATGTSRVFDDENEEIQFDIDGFGDFRTTDASVIHFSNSGSSAVIRGRNIKAFGLAKAGVTGTGRLVLEMTDAIESDQYDALNPNGMRLNFRCSRLLADVNSTADGDCIEVGNGSEIIGECLEAHAPAGQVVWGDSGSCRLRAKRIVSLGVSGEGVSIDIECPEMTGVVSHLAGTCIIRGTTIDSSAQDSSTVISAAAGLTLENCRLVTKSDQTNSLSAAAAQTISVVGSLAYNKAKHENVTLDYKSSVGNALTLGGTTPTAAGVSILSAADAAAQRTLLGIGHALSIYASGTASAVETNPTQLSFGTTSPVLTLNQAGTYLLFASATFLENGSASNYVLNVKLRRTNNTAADVANAVRVLSSDAPEEYGPVLGSFNISLPVVVYTTANNDDLIAMFASNGTDISMACSEASILAVRIA